MKTLIITSLAWLGVAAWPVEAQGLPEASLAAEATMSASVSAKIKPEARALIQERKDQDVTETTGSKTDALAAYLLERPAEKLSWYNFMRVWIRAAVNHGLPSNLIVLLMLFPLVSLVIAFSRHVIGLRGFGIYTPAVLSVALVSTGIPLGITIFLVIIVVSVLLHKLLRRVNLPHLPKTSLILWGVSVAMILFLIVMACADVQQFLTLSIFPLLILISLSENFTSTQLMSTTKEAVRLTAETLLLAIISAVIIDNSLIQRLVIVNPELTLLLTLIFDVLVGQYSGLRLLELVRFRPLLEDR